MRLLQVNQCQGSSLSETGAPLRLALQSGQCSGSIAVARVGKGWGPRFSLAAMAYSTSDRRECGSSGLAAFHTQAPCDVTALWCTHAHLSPNLACSFIRSTAA